MQMLTRYFAAWSGNTGKAMVMKKQNWHKWQSLAITEVFRNGYLYYYLYYLYYHIHLLLIDPPTLMISRYTLNKSDHM